MQKYKALLIPVVAIAGFLAWRFFAPGIPDAQALSEYAQSVVEQCKEASYRPGCYEEEVPQLMDDDLTMEQAFEITRIIQTLDRSYAYCHVLGHNFICQGDGKRSK